MRWSAFINVSRKIRTRAGASHLRSYGIVTLFVSTRLLVSQSATVVEPATTTLHVRTQIVLLDAAVVDKRGHPISSILDREDFAVTEDGKPQQLVVFEPPSPHSRAATTVFVLDDLNTGLGDSAYNRICLEKYLRALPESLSAPAELIVLSATSLRIAQSSTRSRAALLSTLTHLSASGVTLANIEPDRFRRTLSALQSVALEHLGEAGRTNIVWLGPGDGADLNSQSIRMPEQAERFVRYLTNTLVEGRMTLYVVFPPSVALGSQGLSSHEQDLADPYSGGFNFRTLAAETGGSVYIATNDLAAAMREAFDLGRGYYTLGYRPDDAIMDGRFRRIRVTLRNSNVHIVTKSGYYAPGTEQQNAPQTMQVFQMTEAGTSPLPFHNLELRISHIDRSPDGKTAEFTISAEGNHIPWRSEGEGQSLAELTVGGLSLSKQGKVLSSHFRNANMLANSQDPAVLQEMTASFKLTLSISSDTHRVRLVVSSRNNGRLGSVDADRAVIDAAAVKELLP